MKLSAEQLDAHLKNPLAKIYLLHGDEPLLIDECVEKINCTAKQQQFSNLQRLQVTTTFHWSELLKEFTNADLFSQKNYVKLTMPSGKPGATGSKAIAEYLEIASEDCLLVIVCEKLEAATFKTAWYQLIEKQGVVIPTRQLQGNELRNWLKRRFTLQNMQITSAALEIFAMNFTGNLLAAQQEIQKLYLIYGPIEITEQHIVDSTSDQAHFDIFNLVDAWLSNDYLAYLRILKNLHAQDIAPTLILWALSRDARQLAQVAFAIEQGMHLQQALQGIPNFRRTALERHLKNHAQIYYHQFLQHCATIDRTIKGIETGNVWLLLERLTQEPCQI